MKSYLYDKILTSLKVGILLKEDDTKYTKMLANNPNNTKMLANNPNNNKMLANNPNKENHNQLMKQSNELHKEHLPGAKMLGSKLDNDASSGLRKSLKKLVTD